MTEALLHSTRAHLAPTRPRLGFLGVGWIGLNRLEAIASSGVADIAAIADPSGDALARALHIASGSAACPSLDALLDAGIDGVVIATPSAGHADQAIAALERGVAVFCQKPLARTARETRRVIAAARAADRLLAVDLSYRYTEAMQRIRELVQGGALGHVHAVDVVFHNAYGPDKAWFRDARLSGGGCVIDLGIHLVDLALWTMGDGEVQRVSSHLYADGRLLQLPGEVVEDYAVVTLELTSGATVRLACSWNAHMGCDAVIEASFHGSRGGAVMRNLNGSFYDFVAEHFVGTRREVLCEPPDAWSGRAAVDWARRLAAGERFDPDVERLVAVAEALDAIYGR